MVFHGVLKVHLIPFLIAVIVFSILRSAEMMYGAPIVREVYHMSFTPSMLSGIDPQCRTHPVNHQPKINVERRYSAFDGDRSGVPVAAVRVSEPPPACARSVHLICGARHCALCDRIRGRRASSRFVCIHVSVGVRRTQQKHLADDVPDPLLLLRTERAVVKRFIQPLPQRTGLPGNFLFGRIVLLAVQQVPADHQDTVAVPAENQPFNVFRSV